MGTIIYYIIFIVIMGQFILLPNINAQWNNPNSNVFSEDAENSEDAETSACLTCHQKVLDNMRKFTFQHSPIVSNKCSTCHISKDGSDRRVDKAAQNTEEKEDWGKVQRNQFSNEHIVVMGNLSNNSDYRFKIDLEDKKGKKNSSETLSFKPESISKYWTDDETPPTITNVGLVKMDVSVFIEAAIGWETNEFADSKIEYGTIKKYDKSAYSASYYKKHNFKLTGLKHKAIYHYRVTSKDIFGNVAVSEDKTFDTSKMFKEPEIVDNSNEDAQEETSGEEKNKEPKFKALRILKLKPKQEEEEKLDPKKKPLLSKVAVFFIASREVKSIIEFAEGKGEDESGTNLSEEEKHGSWGLLNRRGAGIKVCVKCHKQGVSHPVGVSGRRSGIRIPDDFPTGEGGIITCVTCHMPHGSYLENLARLDFKRGICIKCHKGFM